MSDQSNTYEIFVSYSHKDSDCVDSYLMPIRKSWGLKIVLAEKTFLPGDPLGQEIGNFIALSTHDLFICTQGFHDSVWVELMTVTRVFDASRELVLRAWTDPKYVMQWWGPKGFTSPVCKIDFRVGGKFLCSMRSPDGQEFFNGGDYHEIVPYEKIVSSMYFPDSEGNKIEPEALGIEHEAINGAYDVTLFEDLGDGRTKLTFIANEPVESAKNSGQLDGWNQILDKIAEVLAGMEQAK